MLAHQGGWDEMLLPFAVLLVVFGAPVFPPTSAGRSGRLAARRDLRLLRRPLAGGDRRCGGCGFRAVSGRRSDGG